MGVPAPMLGDSQLLGHNAATMWSRILKVLLFATALAAAMQAIRLRLVEPDAVAQACTLNGLQWQCRLRTLVVNGFAHQLYGPISLIAAVLAWVGGIRVFAVLGMLAGMAGMAMWNFELSALGFLLGALLLASGRSEPPVIEQQTQSQ